ncbi:hypothetical protein [Roseomonas populi]|uniref:DUF4852 domain-containing protein n=1 Tax=Roseomonas populi TaxID=3121582 RepID=A0ABT1X849_9PROT|nr:hypothetical protein [Roseomonas pecuniae]MCR0984282.1 hypothetical protein [Roseomonas pecuniae]
MPTRLWVSGLGFPRRAGTDLTTGGAAFRRPAGLAAVCRLLPVMALAALAGCATTGDDDASAQRARPAMDAALARLPAAAAGFERDAVQDVAPGDATAGKVVEYVTPRRVAVAYVFLYDLGRPAVRDADLPPEVERAVNEATALPSDRTGRQLSVAQRYTVPARGGDLSCAALEGNFGRTRVERQVCVGVADGRFLRVQVTMPSLAAPSADARAFAAEVAGAARGGETAPR